MLWSGEETDQINLEDEGETFDCATGIWWGETEHTGKHATIHRTAPPPTKNLSRNVNGPKVKILCTEQS